MRISKTLTFPLTSRFDQFGEYRELIYLEDDTETLTIDNTSLLGIKDAYNTGTYEFLGYAKKYDGGLFPIPKYQYLGTIPEFIVNTSTYVRAGWYVMYPAYILQSFVNDGNGYYYPFYDFKKIVGAGTKYGEFMVVYPLYVTDFVYQDISVYYMPGYFLLKLSRRGVSSLFSVSIGNNVIHTSSSSAEECLYIPFAGDKTYTANVTYAGITRTITWVGIVDNIEYLLGIYPLRQPALFSGYEGVRVVNYPTLPNNTLTIIISGVTVDETTTTSERLA